MSDNNTGQMIQVPNTLRLRVGGRLGAIDPAAIAKAEAALKSLSGNFAEWLADEVAKLDASRQRVRAEAPMALVDAHIDGIKAAVKGHIQTDTHPVGSALVSELERQVREFAAG